MSNCTKCSKLLLESNYEWNEETSSTDVTNTKVVIKINNEEHEIIDTNGYLSSFTLIPSMINTSDFINDGFYEVFFYFTLPDKEVTYSQEFFYKCNLDCKISKFIAEYASKSNCDSCKNELSKIFSEIILNREILDYAIQCFLKEKILEVYQYLDNLLSKYNCKNC